MWAKYQYTVPIAEGWGKDIPPGQERRGDLVFFTDTYNMGLEPAPRISHVGIIVGNGQMLNANLNGLWYTNYTYRWGPWHEHLYAFMRVL